MRAPHGYHALKALNSANGLRFELRQVLSAATLFITSEAESCRSLVADLLKVRLLTGSSDYTLMQKNGCFY